LLWVTLVDGRPAALFFEHVVGLVEVEHGGSTVLLVAGREVQVREDVSAILQAVRSSLFPIDLCNMRPAGASPALSPAAQQAAACRIGSLTRN